MALSFQMGTHGLRTIPSTLSYWISDLQWVGFESLRLRSARPTTENEHIVEIRPVKIIGPRWNAQIIQKNKNLFYNEKCLLKL